MVLQKACALDTAHRNRAMIGILLAFTFFVAEHVYEQRTATYSMERIRANRPIEWEKRQSGRKREQNITKTHSNLTYYMFVSLLFLLIHS